MAKYSKHITLGYDLNGNRIRKRVYADTKADLNLQIHTVKKNFENRKIEQDITLSDYANMWLKLYKRNSSPRTIEMYNSLIQKIGPLGLYNVPSVRHSDIQMLLNEFTDRPNLHNKMLMCLKQIFNKAILDNIITKNPVDGIPSAKNTPKEKRALSEKEKAALKIADLDQRESLFVNIMLYFGLRPGEALALTKDSFDLNTKMLIVDKAITFVGNNPILKSTKTNTIRMLPIPGTLVPRLEEYFLDHHGILFGGSQNIIGEYMTKTAYRIFSKKIFDKINYTLGGSENDDRLNGMTFYTFRHNKATALYYADGLSTKAKAEYMGHSVDMFLKTYSHIDRDKESIEKYNVI